MPSAKRFSWKNRCSARSDRLCILFIFVLKRHVRERFGRRESSLLISQWKMFATSGGEGSRLEFKTNSRDRSDTRYGFTLCLVLRSIFISLRKPKLSTSKSISSVGNSEDVKWISDSIDFLDAKSNRFLFVLGSIRRVKLFWNWIAVSHPSETYDANFVVLTHNGRFMKTNVCLLNILLSR